MRYKKGILAIFLFMVVFLAGAVSAVAAENEDGAENWKLSRVSFSHLKVSFELSGVSSAQEATAVVTSVDDGENAEGGENVEISIPFSIESAIQSFELQFPEDTYLPADRYYKLTLYGAKGASVSSQSKYLDSCYSHIATNVDAYPNQAEVSSFLADFVGSRMTKAYAEVGFLRYEGVITECGAVISYPCQEIGTTIEITIADDYGCEEKYTESVKNSYLSAPPDFNVYRDSYLIGYKTLSENERYAVSIGNEIYYSEYGYSVNGWGKAVVYPVQEVGTEISLWTEHKNGSRSEIKKAVVQECALDQCDVSVNAYPRRLEGNVNVSAGSKGKMPVKVCLSIGAEVYECEIQEDGSFSIEYTEQEDRTSLSLDFLDEHGCCWSETVQVHNTLSSFELRISPQDVTPIKIAKGQVGIKNARLCARIGNTVYRSAYTTNLVDKAEVCYPCQKPGTKIIVWLEEENSSKSKEEEYTILPRKAEIGVSAVTSSYIELYIEEVDYLYNGEWKFFGMYSGIKSGYVSINGRNYEGVLLSEGSIRMNYTARVNDLINIVLTDTDGYTYQTSCRIPNVKPPIQINKLDTDSTKVDGKTIKNADITVHVGNKQYRTKSDANGNFSIKIKSQKSGTKVTVSVVAADGRSGSDSVKIRMVHGEIDIAKFVYRDSRTIICRITGARKGDILKIKVGKKTYKKKIKSKKKTQKVKISIKPVKAGTKIIAVYYDKYKKKKDSLKDMVYYGNDIYVGMSGSDALLTTWGEPVRKNYYGGRWVQWVFKKGRTTLYAYVQGGRVVKIQKINY